MVDYIVAICGFLTAVFTFAMAYFQWCNLTRNKPAVLLIQEIFLMRRIEDIGRRVSRNKAFAVWMFLLPRLARITPLNPLRSPIVKSPPQSLTLTEHSPNNQKAE